MRSTLVTITALVVAVLIAGATFVSAQSPAPPAGTPLFINLTTDEVHRVDMGLSFGKNQLDRGHPLTVFFNDTGVLVVADAHSTTYAVQQKAIKALVAEGATVLACPMCLMYYGIDEADVMEGVVIGNPDLTGEALFQPGTVTLTW
jgi:intracellular sulfur oxidation DsrE/DsrF family protein